MSQKRDLEPESDVDESTDSNNKRLRLHDLQSGTAADTVVDLSLGSVVARTYMHGATERLSPYTNAPLDLEGRGIRLVELQSSSSSDTIRCHLRSYALPPDGPSYIALSYQWGPCERYANIELNGMPFTVGRSLWTFLHQMRLHRVFKTFWIDAICIDQANVEERNHQVGMMRHIYLNAASVSIWLGEVEEDTLVGEAMKIMAPRNLRSGQTLDNIAHWKRWTTREIEAFQAFCEHKYWSRVWIIQEVALARKATIYCGPQIAEFSVLHQLLLKSGHEKFPDIWRTPAYQVVALKSVDYKPAIDHQPDGCCLRTMSLHFANHEATDIRDKIYALLGVSAKARAYIPVDYRISREELYIVSLSYICQTETRSTSLHHMKAYARALAKLLNMNVSQETMCKCIETHFLTREPPFWLRKSLDLYDAPKQAVFVETTISTWNPKGLFALASEPVNCRINVPTGHYQGPAELLWASSGWTNVRQTTREHTTTAAM